MPLVANTTYRIRFGGATTTGKTIGILYFRGAVATQNLTLIVNGYGYGSARIQMVELSKGSAVSYEADDEYFAIKVTPSAVNGGQNAILGYFTIAGTTPTIETVD